MFLLFLFPKKQVSEKRVFETKKEKQYQTAPSNKLEHKNYVVIVIIFSGGFESVQMHIVSSFTESLYIFSYIILHGYVGQYQPMSMSKLDR